MHCEEFSSFLNGIHYHSEGVGQAVVLVHGASSNLNEFYASGLFPALSKKFHTIALDRPGMGLSKSNEGNKDPISNQIDLIYSFMKELKLQKPIIVGHSLGAAVGAGLIAQYPDFAGGFLSIAGAVSPVGSGRVWYTNAAVTPVFGGIFRHLFVPYLGPSFLPSAIERNFAPDPVPENYESTACLRSVFKPSIFKSNAEDLNAVFSFHKKIYPSYDKIKIPVSLVYGKQDSVVSPELHTNLFKAKVPQTKAIFLEDSGHLPHHGRVELIFNELSEIHEAIKKEKQPEAAL